MHLLVLLSKKCWVCNKLSDSCNSGWATAFLDRSSVWITNCSGRIGLDMRVHAASCGPHDSLPLILILFNTAFIHVAIRRVICTCTNNIAIAMQVCISCNLYAGLFNSCSLFRSFKFVTGTQYPSHCSCMDSYIYIRCSYIVISSYIFIMCMRKTIMYVLAI